jgi:serine/threonine protein kinase, bacterial
VVDGTRFGPYRLVELLGRGDIGEVWRAEDPDTNRVVALKVLSPDFAANQVFQERFRREARAAAGLAEPHIIPIDELGEVDGRLYVTMRLVRGHDLRALLQGGPLEPRQAVNIIEQIASALNAAHEIGLVHRDVKPSNILLDEDDVAHLSDFGTARAADQDELTSTGATSGTWAYMAPERFSVREVDSRADIYALACVLYECLTGSPPFPADTVASQVAAHLIAPPPRPSITQPGLPPEVDEVIATGMAKDPDQRYATTIELMNAARDALTTVRPQTRLADPTQPAPTLLDDRLQSPTPPATQPARQQAGPLSPATTAKGTLGWAADRWAHHPAVELPELSGHGRRPVAKWLLAIAIVVLVGITGYLVINTHRHTASSLVPASPTAPATPSVSVTRAASGPTSLTINGLRDPEGVAVDALGNVYVADHRNRVVMWVVGLNTQTVLPFSGLERPGGVAVDTAGDVYVTDMGKNQVVKWVAGSSAQTVLPFSGLDHPGGVAVDAAGDVYVTDWGSRVVKWAAGSSTQSVLPVTGLRRPGGVAVDAAGDVYVTDWGTNRVVKWAAAASTQTDLPFTGLNHPGGVAVDTAGDVYVADYYNNRLVRWAAASSTQTALSFTGTGLNKPLDVAVDSAGSLYVTFNANNRVLKVPTL